jgi:hypothetical protein
MKRLLLFVFLISTAHAQTFVIPQPDCLIFFHFTVTGQTSPTSPNAGLDNRTNGCTTWNVSFTSVTLTNASITLQSAPNTATGVPGAWVTYANQTVINGTNPLTIAATPAAGFAWVVGYNPWVRVLLTISGGPASGVVDGAAYGWRIPSASSSPLATSNVNIVSPLGQAAMAASIPVVIASDQSAVGIQGVAAAQADGASNTPTVLGTGPSGTPVATYQPILPYVFNGATWDRDFVCTNRATFNLSGAGDTQIIAASGTTIVRICHISLSTVAPEDIKFTQGTGANCVTGPVDLTGLYKQVTALAFDFGSVGALRGTASQAICINQSVAQATGGVVIYAQY